MSIAASVVLHPSVRLGWLCTALRCAVCVSALACPEQCWSLLCIVLAAFARGGAPAVPLQLDISASGQFTLSVYQYTAVQGGAHPAPACVAVRTDAAACAHTLRTGTLIWPGLLLLHLAAPDQRRRTLLVLPDSVDATAWRALMLACRALAVRGVHE